MNHLYRFLFATVMLLLVARTAAAQGSARATLTDPALDALVAEALVNTPQTASARETVEAARGRIVPAGTPSDVFFCTTLQNDGRAIFLGEREGSFPRLMVSQPLSWPGRLSLTSKAALSEAREVGGREKQSRGESSNSALLNFPWAF